MNSLEIRKLEHGDLVALAELYEQLGGEKSNLSAMIKTFGELERRDDYVFLCAELEGQPAGSVMGIICGELYGDCRPFMVVEDMIIDRRHRNKGIGKALIGELQAVAKRAGCYQMLLITDSRRETAVSFYTSLGFVCEGYTGFKKKL